MEVGMLAHIPIGTCCTRPRFNAVGGIDGRVRPSRLRTALRRKLRSIAGDRAAAERLEPVLPETGVCDRPAWQDTDNCGGGPALSNVDVCGVADANAGKRGKVACRGASQ
jgi:hypothetical protein